MIRAPSALDQRHIAPSSASWTGRVGMYTLMAGYAGSVPLPWLPDALVRTVRGALVRDLAARRNLPLTSQARRTLAARAARGKNTVLVNALKFVGGRLALRAFAGFTAVRIAWPLHEALEVYVLGRLFDRYLDRRVNDPGVPLGGEEAERIRFAIDSALMHALRVHMDPTPEPPTLADDRDPITAIVDGLLAGAADVPERLTRRLDASFDDLIAS
jgi:hypothetical protein